MVVGTRIDASDLAPTDFHGNIRRVLRQPGGQLKPFNLHLRLSIQLDTIKLP